MIDDPQFYSHKPRNEFYCQCMLKKRQSDGYYLIMTSYIPSQIAQMNKTIRLRNSANEPWDEGWVIFFVGPKRAGSLIEDRVKDYEHQREVSDI